MCQSPLLTGDHKLSTPKQEGLRGPSQHTRWWGDESRAKGKYGSAGRKRWPCKSVGERQKLLSSLNHTTPPLSVPLLPMHLFSSLQQTRDTFHPVTGYFAVCQLSKTRGFSALIPLLCRAAVPCFLSAILKIPKASAVFYFIYRKKKIRERKRRREATFLLSVLNSHEAFSDKNCVTPKTPLPGAGVVMGSIWLYS